MTLVATLSEKQGTAKKTLLATLILLAFSAFYLFTPRLFDLIDYGKGFTALILSTLVSFAFKVLVSTLCFLVVKKVLRRKVGITAKGFVLGFFIYGAIMLAYCISNFFSSFPFKYQGDSVDYSTAFKLIPVYIVRCLGIGIGEEAVWRVLGVNLYLYAFGENRKGKFFAVLIPSVIFGLAHLNNLISSPTLINSTISQVFYAGIIGFYFAVCYLKSDNIIPCILLHALFDLAYYVCRGFYPRDVLENVIKTDVSPFGAIVNVITNLPLLIFALLLLFDVFKKMFGLTKETDISVSEEKEPNGETEIK